MKEERGGAGARVKARRPAVWDPERVATRVVTVGIVLLILAAIYLMAAR